MYLLLFFDFCKFGFFLVLRILFTLKMCRLGFFFKLFLLVSPAGYQLLDIICRAPLHLFIHVFQCVLIHRPAQLILMLFSDMVEATAQSMIGNKLITKQTGADGRPCNMVLVVEKTSIAKE